MSHVSTAAPSYTQKAESLLWHSYEKLVHVIVESRTTMQEDPTVQQVNKWFNYETFDSPRLRHALQEWRNAIGSPLQLDVYFSVDSLNQTLLTRSSQSHLDYVPVTFPAGANKRRILVEQWSLQVVPPASSDRLSLPNVYRDVMVLVRAVVVRSRLLPAGSRRMTRSLALPVTAQSPSFQWRILKPASLSDEDIALDASLLEEHVYEPQRVLTFEPLSTPFGQLVLSVQYRRNCDFYLVDNHSTELIKGSTPHLLPPSLPSAASTPPTVTALHSPQSLRSRRTTSVSLGAAEMEVPSPQRNTHSRLVPSTQLLSSVDDTRTLTRLIQACEKAKLLSERRITLDECKRVTNNLLTDLKQWRESMNAWEENNGILQPTLAPTGTDEDIFSMSGVEEVD